MARQQAAKRDSDTTDQRADTTRNPSPPSATEPEAEGDEGEEGEEGDEGEGEDEAEDAGDEDPA